MTQNSSAAQAIEQHLAALIASQGPISVADYMGAALYHPQHGYYVSGDPVGAQGDFITAPEVSQIFGELIGLWCLQSWFDMGSPKSFVLAELGPGRGALMADLLRAAQIRPEFLDAAQIHLIESNGRLRGKQRAKLDEYNSIHWHETVSQIPQGPALFIANEFFDCLPVRQFVKAKDGWHERVVGLDSAGRFAFALAPDPLPSDTVIPHALRSSPKDAVVEVSPGALSLVEDLAKRFVTDPGRLLVIDYGYSTHQTGDTLQGLKSHQYHDVLKNPGAADLTTHVNFAALAQTAHTLGARVEGPARQRSFLFNLGLEARAQTLLKQANPKQAQEIRAAISRLTDPAQMGDLFKALSISSPDLPQAPGFSAL